MNDSGHKPEWTRGTIIEAFRRYEAETGKRVTWNFLSNRGHHLQRPDYLPSAAVVARRFDGMFSNAVMEAYGELNEVPNKDDETRAAIAAIRAGSTAKEQAALYGVGHRTLLKRMQQYREMHPDE